MTDLPYSVPREQRPGADLLVPVSLADGLVLVGWSLLGQVFILGLVVTSLGFAGVDVASLEGVSLGAVLVVTQSLVLAGALAWLSGRGRLSWRLLGSRRASGAHVLAGLGGGVLAFGVSASVLLLGDALLGPLEQPGQTLLDEANLTGAALLTTVVVAGLMAPVLEEVTFRSVLFQTLGRRIGWRGGLVVSSLVFALVHVEVLLPLRVDGIVFMTALFAVGATFGWLFHQSRNLMTAIVAHATFNCVQILMATQQL